MRAALLLLAAASRVSAGWLKWSNDFDQVWTPQETGFLGDAEQLTGWTPKPTPGPGQLSEKDQALELFRRQANTYLNSKTCGYYSGLSSSPWTCSNTSTCATNFKNVVACGAGTYTPFFSVCFDYNAYTRGQCSSMGPETGCCQNSDNPMCGTYMWTGSPPRSMFRCFKSQTIISMLDVPQFVVDASLSSRSLPITTGSGAVTATSDISNNGPGGASSTGPASTTTSGGGGGGGDGGGGGSNTGAIVGGVVGGVGGIALLAGLAAFLIIRRNKQKKANPAYGAVPMNEHGQGSPGMTSPGMGYAGAGASTFPPQSPYANSVTPPTHPHHSMSHPYDPNAPKYDQGVYGGYPNQHSPQPGNLAPPSSTMSPPHTPAPASWQNPQATGSTYNPAYGAPQFPPSELDAGGAPSGHYNNPVEMAAQPQRY